ncbi:MAG: cytochrome P450 [Acidimicrobiaceae bacterium]|nr:cytochrome P450 [Acidimicrobiaceae bacterium]MYG56461.1 cytochrome P450 [Acidimicrobiaceae bacterium]MYJ99069.1 cytochrome P450 [Acidimicrobiaceae bacterium]
MFGLPVERTAEFIELKDGIIRPPANKPIEAREHRVATGERIYAVLSEAIGQRLETREDDFLSQFLDAQVEGTQLTVDEVLDIGYLFFLAGLDTVTASLDCMLAHLAQNPEHQQRLVSNPSDIGAAMEELLRWETPVARGGLGSVFPPDKDGWPMPQSSPAFGDVIGGLATAGAIAAALLKRERTGETSVVDVSLLATALWQISPLVVASKLFGMTSLPRGDRRLSPNPGVGVYRTRDDRFISLILLQSDKHWEDFAARLDRPILVEDERFNHSSVRAQNGPACIDIIDEAFAERTLAEWKERLETFEGVWTPFQTLPELYSDRQVIANTYLPSMEHSSGQEVQLVASPAQFDEQPIAVGRAPELGEHTELVLSEVGFDCPEIIAMKESGAIL